MMRVQSLVVLVLALLAVALLASAPVLADPREIENAEFKEEFGEEFDDRTARSADVDARLEFALEHNIPTGSSSSSFSKRGAVEILLSASLPKPKVTFVDLPTLTPSDIQHLEHLLATDRHYSVRARSDPLDATSPYVMTSIPMCMLAGTRMRENFAFHVSDDHKLVAIEFLTPHVPPAACAEYKKRDLQTVKFSAFGNALRPQAGPSPPKQIATKKERAPQGVKPIKSEDEPADEPEQQSFLRKYWYFVLPLVLFSLFGSDGGAAAPAAGGSGAAPAPAAGGGRRR